MERVSVPRRHRDKFIGEWNGSAGLQFDCEEILVVGELRAMRV